MLVSRAAAGNQVQVCRQSQVYCCVLCGIEISATLKFAKGTWDDRERCIYCVYLKCVFLRKNCDLHSIFANDNNDRLPSVYIDKYSRGQEYTCRTEEFGSHYEILCCSYSYILCWEAGSLVCQQFVNGNRRLTDISPNVKHVVYIVQIFTIRLTVVTDLLRWHSSVLFRSRTGVFVARDR